MRIIRSEEHTSELQSPQNLVCRLLLEKKKKTNNTLTTYIYSQTRDVVLLSQCAAHPSISTRTMWHCSPHLCRSLLSFFFFFFNNPGPPEIYPLPPHAAFPF